MRHHVDSLIDHREMPPEHVADLAILRMEVVRSLKLLTNREQIVLQLRFGLGPYGVSYTLEEAGRVLKCTRERIRGIECKAITKLRVPFRSQNLTGYTFSKAESQMGEA